MSGHKFTVAVYSGGITSLITVIALSHLSSEKRDIHVNIYEAAHKFSEISASMGLWKRPWKVIKMLRLKATLRKLVIIPDNEDELCLTFEFCKSDQAKGVSFYEMKAPFRTLTFYHTDLLQALVEELDPEVTMAHFSKCLVSYTLPPGHTNTSPVTLHFKDGSTTNCDVLIGCNGIHSAVWHNLLELATKDAEENNTKEGKQMAEKLCGLVDPVWSGSVAYCTVIPCEELARLSPNHRTMHTAQNYTGKNKHIIAFLMLKGRLINVVAFCSWPDKEGTVFEGNTVEDCLQTELIEQYKGWEEEVQQLLQCTRKPSRWAINNLQAIPISVHNRVVLAGDAAHAMTPHQGSGAGQALEDAYVLAALLTHPLTTRDTLQDALKVYERVRLPHGNEVQRLSRLNGRLYDFVDPRFKDMQLSAGAVSEGKASNEDTRKLKDIGDAALKNWEWTWTTDIEDDKKLAIRILEERVAGRNNIA